MENFIFCALKCFCHKISLFSFITKTIQKKISMYSFIKHRIRYSLKKVLMIVTGTLLFGIILDLAACSYHSTRALRDTIRLV